MSLSESERRDIYMALESVIGPEVANNLMSVLPHQPANELVTRADLYATAAKLEGQMAELKAELRTDMAELRVTVQRWMTGAVAANTIAVVTALLT